MGITPSPYRGPGPPANRGRTVGTARRTIGCGLGRAARLEAYPGRTTMSTTAEETVTEVETGRTPWGGVASLGIGSFILVTGEFLPASLLSQIAAGIHVSEGVAGQLVTATAITGAVAALAISPLLPRLDRRLVMI